MRRTPFVIMRGMRLLRTCMPPAYVMYRFQTHPQVAFDQMLSSGKLSSVQCSLLHDIAPAVSSSQHDSAFKSKPTPSLCKYCLYETAQQAPHSVVRTFKWCPLVTLWFTWPGLWGNRASPSIRLLMTFWAWWTPAGWSRTRWTSAAASACIWTPSIHWTSSCSDQQS